MCGLRTTSPICTRYVRIKVLAGIFRKHWNSHNLLSRKIRKDACVNLKLIDKLTLNLYTAVSWKYYTATFHIYLCSSSKYSKTCCHSWEQHRSHTFAHTHTQPKLCPPDNDVVTCGFHSSRACKYAFISIPFTLTSVCNLNAFLSLISMHWIAI